jgi:hypothetical protein
MSAVFVYANSLVDAKEPCLQKSIANIQPNQEGRLPPPVNLSNIDLPSTTAAAEPAEPAAGPKYGGGVSSGRDSASDPDPDPDPDTSGSASVFSFLTFLRLQHRNPNFNPNPDLLTHIQEVTGAEDSASQSAQARSSTEQP